MVTTCGDSIDGCQCRRRRNHLVDDWCGIFFRHPGLSVNWDLLAQRVASNLQDTNGSDDLITPSHAHRWWIEKLELALSCRKKPVQKNSWIFQAKTQRRTGSDIVESSNEFPNSLYFHYLLYKSHKYWSHLREARQKIIKLEVFKWIETQAFWLPNSTSRPL